LYFLDDHLLGHRTFAAALFEGMRGMNRVFQAAATVSSILEGDLIEKAAEAGLRSVFVGFETFSPENLKQSNKKQNLELDYVKAVNRLHSLGIMINGSFVFGLDDDDKDVFKRTVEWGVQHAITTATYHVLTPYPGTPLFHTMEAQGRILTRNWDLYDTRHVVYQTTRLSAVDLKAGYDWAYRSFYSWQNIVKASWSHEAYKHKLRHFFYTGGWKKFEPLWNFIIKSKRLNSMLPLLEALLSDANSSVKKSNYQLQPQPAIAGQVVLNSL
jgi:radical SAM superfamily enzyme YgiQ (UPF0313 family)